MGIKFGKWYMMLRIGWFAIGIGAPDEELRVMVDRTRNHKGI